MTTSAGWPSVPEDEMTAFYETADVFLNTANEQQSSEPAERVAAAFLYAACRFTAFAMQAQIGKGAEVDIETRDGLTARFEEELRDHSNQHLRSNMSPLGAPERVPDAAIDVLVSLNQMATEPRGAFMRLADRFIHPANELIGDIAIARISAAMLHACTRFNAFVMQSRGLPPGPLDDGIATDFRNSFRTLLDFHLGQSVVTDREG